MQQYCNLFGCESGSYPLKYLGVPLLIKVAIFSVSGISGDCLLYVLSLEEPDRDDNLRYENNWCGGARSASSK
jgi:hypothetical protein